uniref:Glycosyltransferase 61 catalytic domain-containing protein n=1 Tax=Alexandrium monilatum TaxID=311494 RepID=A0A7S4UVH1_9DINO|mmetsp:Transcript_11453/g.35903  ORF Transcript_11453/g.35903 Transcript_11453/m.35903 type:complete len:553 (-) Transcript_11453:101-1759(-)
MPEAPHVAPRRGFRGWISTVALLGLSFIVLPQAILTWVQLTACEAGSRELHDEFDALQARAARLERQLDRQVLAEDPEAPVLLPEDNLSDATEEIRRGHPGATPQEVLHPHRHVYRIFNDVCIRRIQLDPRVFEQDKSDKTELFKRYDRVLSLCRSAKAEDVVWPLPPAGPAPERTDHPKDWVMSSRVKVEVGGPECGPRSRWVNQAIYLHAGHKITARWPLNPRSLNMAHWMSDVLAPLMVAAVTMNKSFAAPPEALIVDAENKMPPNAIRAARVVADMFGDRWNRTVHMVGAATLPRTICARQLVLPDNVVEMRFSDGLPTPTDDGTGELQAWEASFGQSGPKVEVAKQAAQTFRRRALKSCGIVVRESKCMRSVALFGRDKDRKRSLLNTEALMFGLQSEGLDVQTNFDFATMPWCDTLRVMSSVDLFVSLHGANVGFNVFYMKPSAAVLELFPNSSHSVLLAKAERKLYRKEQGHWSQQCPWDYFVSLNIYQALSLKYKCMGAQLPPGTVENQLYPANYACSVCVPCVLDWVRKVDVARGSRSGEVCG